MVPLVHHALTVLLNQLLDNLDELASRHDMITARLSCPLK